MDIFDIIIWKYMVFHDANTFFHDKMVIFSFAPSDI